MTYEEVHRAIKRGDVITLRNALDDGLDPNLTNRFGWTILMLAALKGNSHIGRMLIDYGADVDMRNRHGSTALSLAPFGSASFFEMLLVKGASLDVHLDWVGYSYPERKPKLQKALDNERERRLKRDKIIDSLIA